MMKFHEISIYKCGDEIVEAVLCTRRLNVVRWGRLVR